MVRYCNKYLFIRPTRQRVALRVGHKKQIQFLFTNLLPFFRRRFMVLSTLNHLKIILFIENSQF